MSIDTYKYICYSKTTYLGKFLTIRLSDPHMRKWKYGRADKAEQQVKEMEAITKYLIADKRFADLERAVDDLEFRKKLLKEYKIE